MSNPCVSRLAAFLAATTFLGLASAQGPTDFDGTKTGFTWSGDCNSAVVFRNTSGVDLCDLWVSVGDDAATNPPEIGRIVVTNGSGTAVWDVDDNEDKDNDDSGENDSTDSTPLSDANGWHRSQARDDSSCIANGATFTVQLCDSAGAPWLGAPIYLWGTTSAADPLASGGDGGVFIASPPKRISQLTPVESLAIPNQNPPPFHAYEFSYLLINDGFMPVQRVAIVPNDPDFDLINVHANVPINFTMLPGPTINFTNSLAPGASAQLWIEADHPSQVGPTTNLRIVALGLPPVTYCVPKQNSQGCMPMIGSQGIASASMPQPFFIVCQQVINNKSGLLFYGHKAASIPFQGGTLCVQSPKRTPGLSSGGSPPPNNCTGTFLYDFNARIQSGVDPALVPAAEVFAEFWYRDPPAPFGTGLSNAIHFVVDV